MYYIVDEKHKDAPKMWAKATTNYQRAPKSKDGTKFLIEFSQGEDISDFPFLGTAYTAEQLRPQWNSEGEQISLGALAINGFE